MELVTTERLIVRRPTQSDLDSFLAYRNCPDSLNLQPVDAMTEVDALKLLSEQSKLDTAVADGWIMFAIELKSESRMIGEVGMYVAGSDAHVGDIGWSINPNYQRQGYATEAVAVLISYAFAERGFHRLTATLSVENEGSVRLAERIGMRREAHFRSSCLINGKWHDEFVYAILRDEWEARQ